MTRAQLLGLAAFLSAAGAGIYFANRSDNTVNTLADNFGALEVVDRSQCSMAACNAAQCVQAQNILADAGSPCTTKLVSCPVRFGQRARNLATDAGQAFGPALYQQVRLIALRCPAAGGGFSFGVPVDDTGWPVFATAADAFPCAWRNPDAGAVCTLIDGGDPGDFNTMQPGQFTGAGCQPKSCVEIAGASSAP